MNQRVEKLLFFQKKLETPVQRIIMHFVPPDDDFGDWATPKESKAGHFLRAFFCGARVLRAQ
jgi:hypothetical protein